MFDAICSGFVYSPPYCVYIDNRYQPNIKIEEIKSNAVKGKVLTYVIHIFCSIFALLLFGTGLYLVYQKIYERILNEKVADIVRDSVINYSSLKNNE